MLMGLLAVGLVSTPNSPAIYPHLSTAAFTLPEGGLVHRGRGRAGVPAPCQASLASAFVSPQHSKGDPGDRPR